MNITHETEAGIIKTDESLAPTSSTDGGKESTTSSEGKVDVERDEKVGDNDGVFEHEVESEKVEKMERKDLHEAPLTEEEQTVPVEHEIGDNQNDDDVVESETEKNVMEEQESETTTTKLYTNE